MRPLLISSVVIQAAVRACPTLCSRSKSSVRGCLRPHQCLKGNLRQQPQLCPPHELDEQACDTGGMVVGNGMLQNPADCSTMLSPCHGFHTAYSHVHCSVLLISSRTIASVHCEVTAM
jgi:hypothetical protein